MDLKVYSSSAAKDKCNALENDIKDMENEISQKKESINKKIKDISMCDSKTKEVSDYHKEYERLKKYSFELDYKSQYQMMENYVYNYERNGKIVDKEKELLKVLRDMLIAFTDESIPRKLGFGLENLKGEEIYGEISINDDVIAPVEHRYYKGGWFQKKPSVSDFLWEISKAFDKYSEQLKEYIQNKIDKIKEFLKPYCEEFKKYSHLKTIYQRECSNNKDAISHLENEIKKKNAELTEIKNNQEADKKIIDEYKNISNEEYSKIFDDLRKRLNSTATSASDKICILIYMALLEKDFNNIIGGDENAG
jgi:hypothetical protein